MASPRQGDFAKPDYGNEASVRHLAYPANGPLQERFRRVAGLFCAVEVDVQAAAGEGSLSSVRRTHSRRSRRAALTAISESGATPLHSRGPREGGLKRVATISAVGSGTLPVSLRKASRPRESRERIVPTGTPRTAATSS